MKLNRNINKVMIGVVILLAACAVPKDEHHESDHHEETDHHEHHDENLVNLTSDQMDLMGVTIANPESLSLENAVQSSGRLEVPPGKRAIVGSITDGRISEIMVMQGDQVKKGQVIARIEHPDIIELQEQYLVSKSKLAFIRSQYNRNKLLLEEEAISEFEFQDIETQFKAEEAINQAFKAKLKLMNIDLKELENGRLISSVAIVSPISGFIHLILTQLGSYVSSEMPLFNIVDIDHIHMDLSVYERDIHKVKKGNLVAFTLVDQPERIYKGNIFSVGRNFEEGPRTLTVHAEINNKDGNLLPGMYINARIITDSNSGLCIPNDGLVATDGKKYIFKVKSRVESDFVFERVEVITGTSDLGFTLITGKDDLIKPNDMLVVSGAYFLASEMAKGELEHHH